MGRARDPTNHPDDLTPAARSSATVTAHLAALGGASDGSATLTDDVALTIMETGEVIHGRATVAAFLTYLHGSAFMAPPVVLTLTAEAERVMLEAEFTGRQVSEFAGIPPTSRQVRLPYVVAYDLDAHAISAMRLYFPMDLLVRQLRET